MVGGVIYWLFLFVFCVGFILSDYFLIGLFVWLCISDSVSMLMIVVVIMQYDGVSLLLEFVINYVMISGVKLLKIVIVRLYEIDKLVDCIVVGNCLVSMVGVGLVNVVSNIFRIICICSRVCIVGLMLSQWKSGYVVVVMMSVIVFSMCLCLMWLDSVFMSGYSMKMIVLYSVVDWNVVFSGRLSCCFVYVGMQNISVQVQIVQRIVIFRLLSILCG